MLIRLYNFAKRNVKKTLTKALRSPSPINVEDWLDYYMKKPKQAYQENASGEYPSVSIIVLTYNNLIFNKLCLESIYANTKYPNFEVIVVDNASTDGTPAWLLEYSKLFTNLRLILNCENKGFAGGNNQAVKSAKGEYIIFLNNDTVVTSSWIEKFLNHFKTDSQIGLVGPVTNSTGNEARISSNYNTPIQMEIFSEARSRKMRGISFDIRMLAFYCVMAKKEQFESIGGLDEQFGVGMFEDDDLAVRYRQAGYRIICAEDIFIHHFQGASFGKLENAKYLEIFEENKKKYEKKWGQAWEPYKSRETL